MALYNASPLFDIRFPRDITVGGWLGGALMWHFATMWLLSINGVIYLLTNVGAGRLRNKFFPLSPRAVLEDLGAALHGHLSHDDPRHYNAVRRWSLADLAAVPQREQSTRHICVEGWSAIGKWGGMRFSEFLARVGADITAKFVGFKCVDDYYTSIYTPTALHPQTLLTLSWDGESCPRSMASRSSCACQPSLAIKNPKYIQTIYITNTYPGGYCEDRGYNWFGGG